MCSMLSKYGAMGTNQSFILNTNYFKSLFMNFAYVINKGQTFNTEVRNELNSLWILFNTIFKQNVTKFICKSQNLTKMNSHSHSNDWVLRFNPKINHLFIKAGLEILALA